MDQDQDIIMGNTDQAAATDNADNVSDYVSDNALDNNPLKRRCTATQHPDAAARYVKGSPAPGWNVKQPGIVTSTSSSNLSTASTSVNVPTSPASSIYSTSSACSGTFIMSTYSTASTSSISSTASGFSTASTSSIASTAPSAHSGPVLDYNGIRIRPRRPCVDEIDILHRNSGRRGFVSAAIMPEYLSRLRTFSAFKKLSKEEGKTR